MAKRDRAAVHVGLVAHQAQFLFDGQVLAREGLVDFDQVDVWKPEPRFVERLACTQEPGRSP